MDSSTRSDYLTLQSWVGEHTQGLGDLILECASPRAAVHAADELIQALPPRTRAALHLARRHWPRRNAAANPATHSAANKATNADTTAPDTTAAGHGFLTLDDARYPRRLRSIPDPPPWLFCAGNAGCLEQPAVAIVGSRRASRAGLQAAGAIAERLAGAGYVVCSGLAMGIDGAAHRGALHAGSTVAVLASGVDRPSPRHNESLAAQIMNRGCLLSELPMGTRPDRFRFPRRNRIISGMCTATIIVEAALPSGSLHTASSALEQGRDVLVLPWSIYHRGGEGCLRLLRDGAVPITALEELGAFFPGLERSKHGRDALPPGDAGRVLSFLGDGALSSDELRGLLAMDLEALLVVLAELELGGWVFREDGQYRRRPRASP